MADAPDPEVGNFGAQLNSIKANHSDLSWQENYLSSTVQTSPEVTAAMKAAALGGADLILYSGHGNASHLGNEWPRILDQTSVQEWTGNTVFVQATCTAHWAAVNATGYKSIAIQALTQPQGGIAAGLGTSTYMNPEASTRFVDQLLSNVNGSGMRWGAALLKTQQWAARQDASGEGWMTDLSKTEQLFGDPAMLIYSSQSSTTTGGTGSGTGTGTGTGASHTPVDWNVLKSQSH